MSNASRHSALGFYPIRKSGSALPASGKSTASTVSHHDALEFPDGQVVLLTRLCEGQRAAVLELPAATSPAACQPRFECFSSTPPEFDLDFGEIYGSRPWDPC
jgi:hypothetical protein